LIGHCEDIIELYHCLDVFALSSLTEALPNVVLEAMAMQVPVVATRVSGVPGVIRHGVNGLLIDPDEVTQLSDSLGQLLRDARLRKRLGHAGRDTVQKEYAFGTRMQAIRQIYERILAPD
jgi:glycosyltransferase involved in cell wall biosynthesis